MNISRLLRKRTFASYSVNTEPWSYTMRTQIPNRVYSYSKQQSVQVKNYVRTLCINYATLSLVDSYGYSLILF